MNFCQLCTLLGSPRVQYLKWGNDEIYGTYIELIAEYDPDPSNQDIELGLKANALVKKFITQIKDKFDIDFTSAELGEA